MRLVKDLRTERTTPEAVRSRIEGRNISKMTVTLQYTIYFNSGPSKSGKMKVHRCQNAKHAAIELERHFRRTIPGVHTVDCASIEDTDWLSTLHYIFGR